MKTKLTKEQEEYCYRLGSIIILIIIYLML